MLPQFLIFSFKRGDDQREAVRKRVRRSATPEDTTYFPSQRALAKEMEENEVAASGMGSRTPMPTAALNFLQNLVDTQINVNHSGASAMRSQNPDDPMGVARGVEWEVPERRKPNGKDHDQCPRTQFSFLGMSDDIIGSDCGSFAPSRPE